MHASSDFGFWILDFGLGLHGATTQALRAPRWAMIVRRHQSKIQNPKSKIGS